MINFLTEIKDAEKTTSIPAFICKKRPSEQEAWTKYKDQIGPRGTVTNAQNLQYKRLNGDGTPIQQY